MPSPILPLIEAQAEHLFAFAQEKKTRAEMKDWLGTQGVKCTLADLDFFFEHHQWQDQQDATLANIANAAKYCRDLQQCLGQHPAPGLDLLMKLSHHLIFQLLTQEGANHESLKLADQLTRSAIVYATEQNKLAQKERELKLAETKLQLQYCKLVLDQATREAAERIAATDLSQNERIAAMRRAAFKDVADLQASGALHIPS